MMLLFAPPSLPTSALCVLADGLVAAGAPSPAADQPQPPGEPLDLHRLLIPHPQSTFFIRAGGESMLGAGIRPGDLLVVDRAREPRHGDVVIALVDGDFTVKRLDRRTRPGGIVLRAENPAYQPIVSTAARPIAVWGVVTACIHAFGPPARPPG
jgi:DNA polymerase V